MLEQYVIEQCAPTLAGLKTASIFHYLFSSIEHLETEMTLLNEKLNPCDVLLQIMHVNGNRAFIYVYRRKKLAASLKQADTASFLSACGYSTTNVDDCLAEFRRRFASGGEFPHEMGVFLGFPLEDVVGFIENKGAASKYVGFWKVYGDVNDARRMFFKFKKCTQVYRRLYLEGLSIRKLTI